MREIAYCFITIILMISVLQSQEDVEDMMRKLQEATQEKINQSEQAVQDFIDKNDAEFAKFLEEDWRMFQAFKGEVRDEKPKPKTIPVAEVKKDIVYTGKPVEKIPIPKYSAQEKVKPMIEYKFRPDIKKKKITVDFFNVKLEPEYDVKMQTLVLRDINNESISNCWETLSASDYEALLEQTKAYKNNINLNDWGNILLLHEIGSEMFNKSNNESNLFIWFMMSKMGYDIKIGYDNANIFLLIPSKNMIYSTPYLMLNSRKYFIVSLDNSNTNESGAIYTYEGEYPGSDRLFSMNIDNSPIFLNQKINREYNFKYKDTYYTVPVIFNKDAIDFFEYYPQTNFEVYFTSKVTPSVDYSFSIAFKPLIENKSETEAVNIILRFVQTAFEYKTDGEHFGREKPLFPEETLYYKYSDCEDRSILFAHLVRELLGLEVIGLNYPSHIATAVKFDIPVSGDYITYNQKKYLICDPTYINADIGQCMPRFKYEKLEIIHLK
ncbi:MAG: hypothetical protein KAX28_10610 [Candidatus Marinimicrobia bacterium]|nr:hypothetical protein [Candidatus Neomarinimicrobiota bacterium]